MIDKFNTILFILSIMSKFKPRQIFFGGVFEDLSASDKNLSGRDKPSSLVKRCDDRKFVSINNFLLVQIGPK